MPRRRTKKRLIEPKVRLLLWTYLHGIRNESNWRAKMARGLDYGEGNIDTQLIDLLDKNFIEGLSPDKGGPPYRITDEGKRFLQPILFTTTIGIAVTLWLGLWTVVCYLYFFSQPVLMVVYWMPLLLASFIVLALVLLFYPYLLMKLGKISY